MEKMKKEQIDSLITEILLKTGYADIWKCFLDSMDKLKKVSESENLKYGMQDILFGACIQTSFCNSVNMMREILYSLCCEDEDTEMNVETEGSTSTE